MRWGNKVQGVKLPVFEGAVNVFVSVKGLEFRVLCGKDSRNLNKWSLNLIHFF